MESFSSLLVIFFLAVIAGIELIKNVPPTLHTPLMSASNAISGIILIGAIQVAGHTEVVMIKYFALIAVVLALINVIGGYGVTNRMLGMFKRK